MLHGRGTGTFIGVLPGLGALIGISVLLPVTYYLPPDAAIIMLAGIYYGGEYGGSISAILINVPGTPSSAVTAIDGNQMARQGRAAQALLATAVASFVGGSLGITLMTLFSSAIASFALSFTSWGLFRGHASWSGRFRVGSDRAQPLKGIVAVFLGVLLGTIRHRCQHRRATLHNGLS